MLVSALTCALTPLTLITPCFETEVIGVDVNSAVVAPCRVPQPLALGRVKLAGLAELAERGRHVLDIRRAGNLRMLGRIDAHQFRAVLRGRQEADLIGMGQVTRVTCAERGRAD